MSSTKVSERREGRIKGDYIRKDEGDSRLGISGGIPHMIVWNSTVF